MSPLKVSFIGDISLNDNYINLYQKSVNPFLCIENSLKQPDYVIGNLECMAKGNSGENLNKKPRLSTTVDTLNYLNNIRINVVTLAHNHVYDHLEDGFHKTIDFLNSNKIKYIGAGLTQNDASKELVLEKNGLKLGLLNYVTSDTHPELPVDSKIALNTFEFNKVVEDIQKLKSIVDHVVLLLHWGGRVEGGYYPDWSQPILARKLIDAGAGLIIGHHSHTFQPFEIYKGKYIFYSLGNFCFSDYWFEGKFYPMPMRRKITSIVEISFEKEVYRVGIHFFRNDHNSFSTLCDYKLKVARQRFVFNYILKYKIAWQVYYLWLKYLLPFIHFMIRKDLSNAKKFTRLWKALLKRIY